MTLSPVELDVLERLGVSEKALNHLNETAALAASRVDDTMTIAVEKETGAQLLPRPAEPHPRQTVTSWSAHSCADADQRTKHSVYRDLAARITIRADDEGISR